VPVCWSVKPCEVRNESGIQEIASRPLLGATAGRSEVRFHSFVAVRLVPVPGGSKRSTSGRLTPLLLLLRSVETNTPPAGPAPVRVTPSASGSPVPSG